MSAFFRLIIGGVRLGESKPKSPVAYVSPVDRTVTNGAGGHMVVLSDFGNSTAAVAFSEAMRVRRVKARITRNYEGRTVIHYVAIEWREPVSRCLLDNMALKPKIELER